MQTRVLPLLSLFLIAGLAAAFSAGAAIRPEEVPVAPAETAAEETAQARQQPQPEPLALAGSVPLEGEILEDRAVFFFTKPIRLEKDAPEVFALGAGTGRDALDADWSVQGNALILRAAFPENSVIIVDLGAGVSDASGAPLPADQRRHVFPTFAFEPVRLYLHEEEADSAVLGLVFPTAPSLDALPRHVSVADAAGSALTTSFKYAVKEENIVHIEAKGIQQWPVKVEVAKGLPSRDGLLKTTGSRALQYPQDPEVNVRSLSWSAFQPHEQRVKLIFEPAVAKKELRQHLQIINAKSGEAVDYTLSGSDESKTYEAVLHLETPAPIELEIRIAEGLPGAGKTRLKGDYVGKLAREPRPLEIENFWWSQDGREGFSLFLDLTHAVEAESLKDSITTDPEVENLRVLPRGNGRFTIHGDWQGEQRYAMTIAEGLPYADGKRASEKPLELTLQTGETPRHIEFAYPGQFYFPRKAGVPLAVKTRNVERVRLTLYRMFPNNLPEAIEEVNEDEPFWSFPDQYARELATTEVEVQGGRNDLASTELDLDSLFLGKQRGVFCLEGRVLERRDSGEWVETLRDLKLIVWTDMGLLAHWEKDQLVLFAHDLYSLDPLAQAKTTVFSDKNQVLGSTSANDSGIARLTGMNPQLGSPLVAVVEHEDDYSFLELEPRREDEVGFTPSMPSYNEDGYDALLYADRELYRPGETVHLAMLVRDAQGDALADVPLVLNVLKPNGRQLSSQSVRLTQYGMAEVDLETQKVYPTGKYTAELTVPSEDEAIGEYAFNLEEFVPNRIEVKVSVEDPFLVAGEPVEVAIQANHLFGPPAVDRKASLAMAFTRDGWAPEGWKAYRFSNDSTFTPDIQQYGDAQTDESGAAQFQFTYDAPAELTFPVQATVVGRVFELGGRAVAGTAERVLLPSDTLLGVAARSAGGGAALDVDVAAVTPQGEPANWAEATVTLEKQVWNYYVRRYYSHNESNWSESFEPVESQQVQLQNGKGAARFDVSDYGYYRVRVHHPSTRQFSTQAFYSYGGDIHAVDAARPSLIKLTLDQDQYTVGDTARLRVESPFDGKGVLVVQGGDIQRMTTIDIVDGVGTATIDLSASDFPNVWVEATVVHAFDADNRKVYPFSSFAMANVPVNAPARQLEVALQDVPEEMRPAQQAEFTVRTTDSSGDAAPASVTLAAVDEGIHQITGYEAPAPYKWLSRPRKPEYNRAHYYDKVAYDFQKTEPGGGLDALLGKRAAAPDDNWIKPVALWSGVVETGEDGLATVNFDVPEFTGQLRLVAVAASPKALGGAEAKLFVRRPYILRTSMPRFMLPGDETTCRATVFNNSDAPATARIRWRAEGAVSGGEGSREVDVPADGEASVTAEFTAGGEIGQGGIVWEAVFLDAEGTELETLMEDAALPVRAPAAYQSHHELIALEPGETRALKNTRFVDDARTELEIAVSATPLMQLARPLRYLVGYPYGCAEQVTSRLFPMYLLRQQTALLQSAARVSDEARGDLDFDPAQMDMYIDAGIHRLFAMQTSSGGLTFWPGGDRPSEYASVYALHFLTLVKGDREFNMPDENYRALQRYALELSRDWTDPGPSALYLRAYAVYVLALDGNQQALDQIARFDAVELPRAARYMLAAALALNTQDAARVSMYLEKMPARDYDANEQSGTLNSPVRNLAVELLMLQQMEGKQEQAAERAQELLQWLDQQRAYTTQKTAFVTAALSQYLADAGAAAADASALIASGDRKARISGSEVFHAAHEGPDGRFEVQNTGESPIYINWTTRGVPQTPNVDAFSNGIAVETRLYTAKGELLHPQDEAPTLDQTETYIAALELTCEGRLENVLAVDMLPAGLEIENPRLSPDAAAAAEAEFKNAATPAYMDVRDDRIAFAFDALAPGKHVVYYVVRAVTPGEYQHPPATAECMYDPVVQGANALGRVIVR